MTTDAFRRAAAAVLVALVAAGPAAAAEVAGSIDLHEIEAQIERHDADTRNALALAILIREGAGKRTSRLAKRLQRVHARETGSKPELSAAGLLALQKQLSPPEGRARKHARVFREPPAPVGEEAADRKSVETNRALLEQHVARLRDDAEKDAAELVEALIRLGDLHLLQRRRAAAFDLYQEAVEIGEANGLDTRDAFTKPTIIEFAIPEFDADVEGYVEAELTVNKAGRVSRVKIVDTDLDNYGRQQTVKDSLENMRYRPAIVGGGAVVTHGVRLRLNWKSESGRRAESSQEAIGADGG